MRAEEVISVSNNYTNQTVIGMGAIKGAPCTIKSMTKAGKLTTTVFEWTDLNGDKHENTMLVYDGTDGTNGTNGQDGAPGADGFSPTIVVKTSTSTEYILTITDKNGSYDTPNLKGSGGGGGASEMSDLTDVDLTNLANGSALIYDSEAAKWEATDLTLSNITDIDLTGIQDGQVLVWDAEHSKLVPADQTGTQYSAGEGINIDQNNAISSKFVLYTGAKETYEAMPLSERVKYTHTAFNNDSQVGLVDAVPTVNSPNLVTSGGTYSKIAEKANATDLANYQTKDLSSPITVGGTQETTVEGALGALNTLAAGKANPATTLAGYGITNAYTKTETNGAITAEIEKLDVADSAVTGSYVTGVSETDGKISVTREAADAVPTSTSNKMIKSGGVYSAVDDVYKSNGVLGAKNLLPRPYYATNGGTSTSGPFTVTENADGSMTVNGTASSQAYVDYARNSKAFKAGKYILSGGKSSEQSLYINATNNGSYVRTLVYSRGSDAEFELDFNGYDAITVGLSISSGETLNNVTFYPMIRLASDTDSTYQPYAKTNNQLTEGKAELTQISNPNLLDNPWFTVNQRGITTDTQSEETNRYTLDRWYLRGAPTISVNSDGSITIDNTSGAAEHSFMQFIEESQYNKLKGRTVTLSIDAVASGSGCQMGAWQANQSPQAMGYIPIPTTRQIISSTFAFGNVTATSPLQVIVDTGIGKTVTIYSIKLELGSVSTLAMDTAPNYATELLKCQRYFLRIKNPSQTATSYILGMALSTTDIRVAFPAPENMRSDPSIAVSSASDFFYSRNNYSGAAAAASVSSAGPMIVNMKPLIVEGVSLTQSVPYIIYFGPNAYIDFSADL